MKLNYFLIGIVIVTICITPFVYSPQDEELENVRTFDEIDEPVGVEPQRKHWAEIDENGVVLRVIVASDSFIQSGAVGNPNNWVRTYKDRSARKNFASPGDTYRADLDGFITPSPYPSWVLNETTGRYEAPTPQPENTDPTRVYAWNERTQRWVLVTQSAALNSPIFE